MNDEGVPNRYIGLAQTCRGLPLSNLDMYLYDAARDSRFN